MEDVIDTIAHCSLRRFRLLREIEVPTPFRQVQAGFEGFDDDEDDPLVVLPSVMRAEIEREARSFADARGFGVDWDSVSRLDDEALVNGIAQVVPFDVATKQALLEAPNILDRADLLVDFLRFFGDGSGETLQ